MSFLYIGNYTQYLSGYLPNNVWKWIGLMDIAPLLQLMVNEGASDLHLKVPCQPTFRINGELFPQENMPALKPQDLESIFEQITTTDQRTFFAKERELDFAYSINGLARFRINVLRQRGTLSMALRLIPFKVATIEQLALPEICKEIIQKPRGLILVTGPTGSGKSTTLAAMIEWLNENTRRTVITIEDPIEFLYADQQCVIAQRDLGDDTNSFANALKHALRHDPDVLVIGEMRDLDTIASAITAAETGHLVLGTLHTVDVSQTVDRIIDVFPPEQHRQIRWQLAQTLTAVLSQRLVQRCNSGRIAAVEIMLSNASIKKLIHDEKTNEIIENLEMSNHDGMQSMDQSLANLVDQGIVAYEEAKSHCTNTTKFKKHLEYLQQEKIEVTY